MGRRALSRVGVAAGLLSLTCAAVEACGDAADQGAPGSDDAGATASIGPSGGTVRARGVTLTIPSGALSSDVSISITEDPAGIPSGYHGLTPLYRFSPQGLTFAVPSTVQFTASAADTTAHVYWSQATNPGYDALGTSWLGNVASAQVSHFSAGFVGSPDRAESGVDAMLDDATLGQDTNDVPTLDVVSVDALADVSVDSGNADAAAESGGDDTGADASVACGVPCSAVPPSTAVCVSGSSCVVTLASGQEAPSEFAIGATNIYWTTYYNGTIERVGLGGGTRTTVVSGQSRPLDAGGQTFPYMLAVDDANVYWTNPYEGTVTKAPLTGVPDGGAPTVLASGQDDPVGIAVDGTSVYWTNYSNNGSVMKVPIEGVADGGTPTVLASGQNGSLAITVDSTYVYWANQGSSTQGGSIAKVPLDGGLVIPLYQEQLDGGTNPDTVGLGIAVDTTSVYWTNEFPNTSNGSVAKAPLSGVPNGGKPILLATHQTMPSSIVTDGVNVYWTNIGPNSGGAATVMRVPVDGVPDGGAPAVLLSNQNQPTGLAVDGTSVYWTTNNAAGDSLMKLTPK